MSRILKATPLLVLFLGLNMSAAEAQQFKYKENELQPARWYKSRTQVEILPAGPIVKNRLNEGSPTEFVIGLPSAAPGAPNQIFIAPQNAGNGAPRLVNTPAGAGVVIDANNPAPARFGSNIPAAGMSPAANLPNGTTTNRLMGRLKQRPAQIASTNEPVSTRPSTQAAKSSQTTQNPAVYEPYDGSHGLLGSARRTTTDVSGKIQNNRKPGYLLKH